MKLGEYIRITRKKQGLSQFELAEKADLTTNFISLLERGRQVPSIVSLVKIAEGLQISVRELLECVFPGFNSPIIVHTDDVEYRFIEEFIPEEKIAETDERGYWV